MNFPEFNERQLNRLSEYLSNFSIVIVAALVLPNMFVVVDKRNDNEILSGIVIAILFLLASLFLLRNKND